MSNAEKFSPKPGGKVLVRLWEEKGSLVVSVTDNGPGIAEADREVIFDKFHQVRDETAGNPLGTGLGLAISQRIVEHLGGRIWVADTGPGGSEFRFTVPVARAGAEALAKAREANA
jgi:signal transduction histidine kinase